MSKCSQNFRAIISKLRKAKGMTPLGIFGSEVITDNEKVNEEISAAADYILQGIEASPEARVYDFNSLYLLMSQLNNSNLTPDVINEIISKVKYSLSKTAGSLTTNPTLIDVSNVAKLLKHDKSLENFLDSELEYAMYSVSFVNNDNRDNGFNNFVVTDLALEHNIFVYKNDIWKYLVKVADLPGMRTAGLENLYNTEADHTGSRTFSLNSNLFYQDESGKTPYYKVLDAVANKFEALDKYNIDTKGISVTSGYIRMLILTNFDKFISDKHGDVINVNPDGINTFSPPSNNDFKYTLKFKGASTSTWASDSIEGTDVSHHTSSLFKLLSNIIPFKQHNVIEEESDETNGDKNSGYLFGNNRITLGTTSVNVIGAVMNSLPQDLTITIKGSKLTVDEAFERHELNNSDIPFRMILKALVNESDKYEDLSIIKNYMYSIHEFLYNKHSGVVGLFNEWKATNIGISDKPIDIEQILIHGIRNTVKNTYRSEEVFGDGTTLDNLHMDTKVGIDFKQLVNNTISYKQKLKTDSTIFRDADFSTYGGVFAFIDKYADIQLSKESKASFLGSTKSETDVISENTRKFLENLLTKDIKVMNEDVSLADRVLTPEEIISKLQEDNVSKEFDFKRLFKLKHQEDKFNTVTQVKSSEGDSWPTMSIAYVAGLNGRLLAKADPNSFFKQNPNLLKGTTIISEVVGKSESKSIDELNSKDLFKLAFTRNFLMSSINENRMFIQPWNFSDKGKILALEIDSNVQDNLGGTLAKLSSTDLKSQFRNNQLQYYTSIINGIHADLLQIDKSSSMSTVRDPKDKIKQIEEFFEKNTSVKTLEKLVRSYVNAHHNDDDYKNPELVRDLHFSEYSVDGEKALKMNQAIKSNFMIFSNPDLFETWSKGLEGSLASWTLNNTHISPKEIKLKTKFEGVYHAKSEIIAEQIGKHFGINPDDIFDHTIDEEDPKKITVSNLKLNNADGTELSELGKKYLWSRNLILSQYENLSTKGAYIHPFKKKFTDIDVTNPDWFSHWRLEEKERTTGFTKRMVISGASMTIFNKGPQGIDRQIKLAIFKDPEAQVFNQVGNSDDQKVFDGGIPANPFFVAQTISAQPGKGLNGTQKPIGTSIHNGHSTFLKCATFGMTNETIRQSINSPYNMRHWMEKMNHFDIFKGSDHDNIFTTLTGEALSIDLDNLHIPINGEFRQVISIKKSDTGGKRSYDLSYINANGDLEIHPPIKINNLFDLWETFGGAFSSKKITKFINGKPVEKYVQTEQSIQIVNEIIKKHALSGGLKLKDKMIAMFLPESAVKNGATNINNTDVLHHTNSSKPNWFTFDTSFFGIQLDAGHTSDQSSVSEITQVLSAASENNAAPELFNDLYDGIGSIISNTLKQFKDLGGDDKLKQLTKLFVKSLENSSQINNSKIIVDSLYKNVEATLNPTDSEFIPYSNKTIYKQFVSSIISKINTDYIRRKFRGAAMVLNPSQGIMKIYEDKVGKTYIIDDIIGKFDRLPDEVKASYIPIGDSEYDKMKSKIAYVLATSEEFKNDPILLNEINPLDTIRIILNEGEEVTIGKTTYTSANDIIVLDRIENYYEFKNKMANFPNGFEKVYGQTRDLKPVEITYKVNGLRQNSFDLEAVQLKWDFEKAIKVWGKTGVFAPDPRILNFIDYLATKDERFKEIHNMKPLPEHETYKNFMGDYYDFIGKYLQKWVNRSYTLLEQGIIFKRSSESTSANPFDDIFKFKSGSSEKHDTFAYGIDPEAEYLNVDEVTEYKHKHAENIIPKVYQSEFSLEEYKHADINPNFFGNIIKNALNVSGKLEHDVFLSDSKTGKKLGIIVNSDNRYTVDGNILKRKDIKIGESFFVNESTENDIRVRKDMSGKKMYELPMSAKLFKDTSNNEILVVNSLEDLKKFINKSKSKFNLIDVNDRMNISKNIVSDESEDTLLDIYKVLIDNTNDAASRLYLKNKQKYYISLKQEALEAGITKESKTNDMYKYLWENPEGYNAKLKINKAKESYIFNMKNTMYNSWKMSNLSLSARIPAQAYQSFMSMNTVAYTQEHLNNAFVSHWQLWLQGSDFDIDKVYMMMYDYRNGSFEKWSPFFDFSSDENVKNSLRLPTPNGKEYAVGNVEGKTYVIPDTINPFKLKDRADIYNYLKEHPEIEYIHSEVDLFADKFVKQINKHNKYNNENGFKNFVVHKLIALSTNPKNQVASYSPISFGKYTEIGKKIDGSYSLSNYDGHTTFLQQEQNAVGKKVIGAAATGLKDYFALVTYYSNYYDGEISPEDNEFFTRHFHILGKDYNLKKIGGLNLTEKATKILEKMIYEGYKDVKLMKKDKTEFTDAEKLQLSKVLDENDPALSISALLSLATDNAKELMLAKINAGIDFASMHIYMLVLGMDEALIGEFMTSDDALKIKDALQEDFFKSGKSSSVDTQLGKLNPGKKGINKAYFDEFIKIYNYSKELKTLGGLLSANQGIKASEIDIYSIVRKINSIVTSQQNTMFESVKEDLNNVKKQWSEASPSEQNLILKNFNETLLPELIKIIKLDKPHLSEGYIKGRLSDAVLAGVMFRGVDLDRYYESMDEPVTTEPRYFETVTGYYNLLKYTFNILDVVNKLPHFNGMLKSFNYSEKTMRRDINKYAFVTDLTHALVDIGRDLGELNHRDIVKLTRAMSNIDNAPQLKEAILSSSADAYDNYVSFEWLKQLNFQIDIVQIMKYLNIKEMNILDPDKQRISTSEIKLSVNPDTKEVSLNTPHRFIDLSSEFGLAQYKYIMENYLINSLKSKFKSNNFLRDYKFGGNKVFNMQRQIKFYDDKSNHKIMSKIQHGLNLFNENRDDKYNLNIKAHRSDVDSESYTYENIRALDLLYLYNHLVNEGKFGGNRATIFFSQDMENPNTFSRKFTEFQRSMDMDRTLIPRLIERIKVDKDFRHVLYLQIFGKRDLETRSVARSEDFSDIENPVDIVDSIRNRYYTLLDSLDESQIISEERKSLEKQILNNITSINGVLKTKCKE